MSKFAIVYHDKFSILEWAVELHLNSKAHAGGHRYCRKQPVGSSWLCLRVNSCERLHLLIHSSSDSSTHKILKFHRMSNFMWYLTIKPVSWSHDSILYMQNFLFRLIIWPFALKYPTKKSLDFWIHQIMYLTFKSKYMRLEELIYLKILSFANTFIADRCMLWQKLC